MAVEKTNTEEREALQKIKEILEDFDPEETYVGRAFDGCVELAKENIDNDWLYSWKGRYLDEQLKNCRLSDRLDDLSRQLNYKDDAIARLEDVKNQLNKEFEEVKAAHAKLDFKLADAKDTADGLKQTILELKAKLYDMMTREEDEW